MCDDFPYPAWLEAHAINDGDVAKAYESISAGQRSGLKAAIAALHRIWGESPRLREQTRAFSPSLAVREEARAAPFAVYLIEENYRYPACLMAAVMPAVLAGVERILPCFLPSAAGVGGKDSPRTAAKTTTAGAARVKPAQNIRQAAVAPEKPAGPLPNPHLLAALDLAGIERSFATTAEAAQKLLSDMTQTLGPGRLVIIGQPAPAGAPADGPACDRVNGLAGLALAALRLQTPCIDLSGTPRFLSGQKPVCPPAAGDSRPKAGRSPAPVPNLTLDKHHENIWLWPQLGPDWFCDKRAHIFRP